MIKLMRILIILLCLFISPFAISQPLPPPPGGGSNSGEKVVNQYLTLKSSVGGVEEGDYVSGTNVFASAFGGAIGTPVEDPNSIPPAAITYASVRTVKLTIDGVQVNMWDRSIPGNAPPQQTSVYFASTWLPHNYDCEITATCVFDLQQKQHQGTSIYSGSETVTRTVKVKIYNVAQIYEATQFTSFRNTPSGGAVNAKSSYIAMQHDTTNYARGGYWSKQSYLSALEVATSLYSSTHGGGSPPYLLGDVIGETITQSEISGRRASAWLARKPPINFAFLDACHVGGVASFCNEVLFPISDGLVDRCTFGFSQAISPDDNVDTFEAYPKAFYDRLVIFGTVSQARIAAYDAYAATFPLGDPLVIPPTSFVIQGDQYTRLWGVYTSSNSVSGDIWFRKN